MSGAEVADVIGLALFAWSLWMAGALVCGVVLLVERLVKRAGR